MFSRILVPVILLGFIAGCSGTPAMSEDEMQAREDQSQTRKEKARKEAEERELERLVQRQMMDTWEGLREPH